MNFNQKKQAERKFVNSLKHETRSGSKCGLFNEHINNRFEHEFAKFLIYSHFKREGWMVYTEAKWNSGGRGDIAIHRNGESYIIEILCSETEKMLSEKKYPYEIISFKAKDIVGDVIKRLPMRWKEALWM